MTETDKPANIEPTDLTNGRSKAKTEQLAELANTLSKIGVVIVAVTYVVGLVIHSVHLSTFGLFYLNFLQVEYVAAGMLWAFLTAGVYLYLRLLLRGIRNYWKERKVSKLKKILMFIWWIPSAIVLIIGLVQLFVSPSNRTTAVIAVTGVLILNAAMVHVLVTSSRTFFGVTPKLNQRTIGTDEMLSFILGIIFSVSLYGKFAFPKLAHQWGGGSYQKVILLVKKELVDVFPVGFGIDPTSRKTIPVEVILEGSDFLFLVPPNGANHDEAKAIRVDKQSFDAIYYVTEKPLLGFGL